MSRTSRTEGQTPHPERASNVLLLDSPQQRAHGSCHDLRAVGPPPEGNSICLVFTHSHAKQITEWAAGQEVIPETVVIDAAPGRGPADTLDHEMITVESVSGPSNLTDIGVEFDRHLSEISDTRTAICVRSLTALLQYVDVQQVYQFTNNLLTMPGTFDASVHCHLNPSAHDARTVTTLSSLFDAVVEIDQDEPSRPAESIEEFLQ